MRLVVFTLIAGACANHAKPSIDLYERGDYAASARAADQGLADHPDDDALWGMRVRAALALGDADAVGKAYATYIGKRGGDDKELLRDLSEATIAQALASPSARLKIAAIDTVAELEMMSLADDVHQRLADSDDRVVAAAATAVLRGFSDAPIALSNMLTSEKAEARRIAIEGLGRKVGKLALSDLEKATDDPDARVRSAALRWVGQLKDPDGVEACRKHMGDKDENVRAAAASACARIGLGNLGDLAKKALADRSLAVKLAGVDLYAAAHRDDLLAEVATAAEPVVALNAALAIRPTRPELAKAAVMRAAGDPEPTTRAAALNYSAQALPKPEAHELAQRLSGDPDVGVRLAAGRALVRLGDREAGRAIFAAVLAAPAGAASDGASSHAGDHIVSAATDLAALGDPRGLEALARAVRDPAASPESRAQAATAHRMAHHVTPGLVAALADPSGIVRIEAASAIAALAK